LLFVLTGILSCSETVSTDGSMSQNKARIRESGSGKDAGSLQPSEFKIFPVDHKGSSNPAYSRVHTLNRKIQGYVKNEDLLFPASQMMNIKKIDNHWKIIAFAPFD